MQEAGITPRGPHKLPGVPRVSVLDPAWALLHVLEEIFPSHRGYLQKRTIALS